MIKDSIITKFFSIAACANTFQAGYAQKVKTPNVIIINADDLGFGDISCNGQRTLLTPNIDKLAKEGLNFYDAHSSAATSTPSRYSLLTGYYPSRNIDANVLPGDAPLIIDTQRQNLPKIFKSAGYTTGVVGKWHLGLGVKGEKTDWNQQIIPGANEVGFDYSYLLAATCDRMPNVYVENGTVVNLDPNDPIEVSYKKNFPGMPTGKDNPELLRLFPSVGHNQGINNGVPRIGYMKGGTNALFVDENMADTFLLKAKDFVAINKDKPFFLYYALHEPHVPRLPNERFLGRSGMGTRGDAILEADWCVGEFMKYLDECGIRENTIVIFTSDNGPVLDDGYKDEAVEKVGLHKPSGPFRGMKCDYYEGGTRVPFIVNWKSHIKPGISNALVSQLDFLPSFASFLNQECISVDGENVMNAFLGKSNKGREKIILEGYLRKVSFRYMNWSYVPAYGKKSAELYDLRKDIAQKNDLSKQNPRQLQMMKSMYEELYTGCQSE
ncbi:MAG: sulfatase-like hydrolase/transferase [Bacteroidales bacterium]|nr:sulfatase-like hydrolase/transferase [Bacteroidales bacterium]